MPAAPTGLHLPAGEDFLPHRLPAGTEVHRVHWADKGPVFFGPKPGLPPANRFDAPGGEYRTLYAAERFEGAFVETVLRDPRRRIIDPANVAGRACTALALRREAILAKLFDQGLRWHGVDGSISAMDDYGPPRAAAFELFSRFPRLDGIAYRSRHNNGLLCYALFDRFAEDDLAPRPHGGPFEPDGHGRACDTRARRRCRPQCADSPAPWRVTAAVAPGRPGRPPARPSRRWATGPSWRKTSPPGRTPRRSPASTACGVPTRWS